MLKDENPVRRDAENVMSESGNVRINQDVIPEFCEFVVENYEFQTADWDAPVFPTVERHGIEDTVDFLLVGNALNYCFNNLETGEKFRYNFLDNTWPGAFGMWASLMDAYQENNEILDSSTLCNLTLEEVQDIFRSSEGTEIPMVESRLENLQSVGRLMGDVGGTFWNLFESGEIQLYGMDGVVTKLSTSRAYQDIREYKSQKVRFDKRSQLAVSMLYGKLLETSYEFKISDMDEFTVFADYGIPAGLASHRVLQYSEELENRIEAREQIPEGSQEEVEIRSATVVAVEKIKAELERNYDVDTRIPVLDYVLWRMRTEAETNEHLTETTSY